MVIVQELLLRNEFSVIVQEVLRGDTKLVVIVIIMVIKGETSVLSSTLFQIWDRLNLPMLLFKVGLLTLM